MEGKRDILMKSLIFEGHMILEIAPASWTFDNKFTEAQRKVCGSKQKPSQKCEFSEPPPLPHTHTHRPARPEPPPLPNTHAQEVVSSIPARAGRVKPKT
jgi:hypothetical protein